MKPIAFNNTQPASLLQQEYMAVCHKGHVTYTFLLCGSAQSGDCSREHSCYFPDHLPRDSKDDLVGNHIIPIIMFNCSDGFYTLSYTLVCDFISDCPDNSDETFCQHPMCVNAFTCNNGQCLPFRNVCDQIPQCIGDENNCDLYRSVVILNKDLLSPVLVSFDGKRTFTSTPMSVNESCPDSHYRCPGDYNDCLPVYTRCNGMYDCLDHMDEERCEELACPGFFRCRMSATCIHSDQLCDGWPHCPSHDDELVCYTSCPVGCQCQGHTFLCLRPFSATQFPHIRSLDATGSGMTLADVNSLTYLIHLVLARCSLTSFADVDMVNLRFLVFSENNLQHVNMSSVLGSTNIKQVVIV